MENTTSIHIGKNTSPIILENKQAVRGLQAFSLTTDPYVLTTWTFVGRGFTHGAPPANIFSNEHYPLRIRMDGDFNQIMVILLGRPLGFLQKIEMNLYADERKDLIRFVSHVPIQQDVVDTLVDLGVEVDMPNIGQQSTHVG